MWPGVAQHAEQVFNNGGIGGEKERRLKRIAEQSLNRHEWSINKSPPFDEHHRKGV